MAKKPVTTKTVGNGETAARPLWAPWRIEFITGAKAADCFLCEKGSPAGGADSVMDEGNHVIARGRHVYVLMNAFPYNSGHLMVAPYRHVGDLTDLNADELAEMTVMTVEAEKVLIQADVSRKRRRQVVDQLAAVLILQNYLDHRQLHQEA